MTYLLETFSKIHFNPISLPKPYGFLLAGLTLLGSSSYAQTQIGAQIDGEAPYDHSGSSVSLSANGSRLAIGAPRNNEAGENAGHVRVYEWNAGNSRWTQLGADIDGEAAGDRSGWSLSSLSLSADGKRLAIGAPSNDGGGGDSGHVRVYEWNAGNSRWTQLGADIDGEAAEDESGTAVSLSADGSRLAIGAPRNDGGGGDSGHVRVYEWKGTSWTQLGADINGEAAEDKSGRNVSLSADGSRLAIGAPRNDGGGDRSGHVRVYEWKGTSWTQLGTDIDGEAAWDSSGWSLSLSADGQRLAIGAGGNSAVGSNSGHVRVYEWKGTSWTQLGADIDGEAAHDFLGASVALSAKGQRLAIGAPGDLIQRASSSGYVRVYKWTGTSWTQIGADINDGIDDIPAASIALSSEGQRLAIGAPSNIFRQQRPSTTSGYVRVYAFPDIAAPDAPTGLRTSAVSADGFTVHWTAVPGATGYHLDVSTEPDFSRFLSGYQNKELAASALSEQVRIPLTQGKMYHYRLRAVNAKGAGFYAAAAAGLGYKLPYTEDFDTSDGGWTAGGVESSWAWGTPKGTTIKAASGGSGGAWVTNLSGNYNDREASWVKSPVFDLSDLPKGTPIHFAFDIRYHIKMASFDHARLQYTTDGSTWQNFEPSDNGSQHWDERWRGESGGDGYLTAFSKSTALAEHAVVSFRVFLYSINVLRTTYEGFAFDRVRLGLVPGGLRTSDVSANGFTIHWEAVPGATGYQLDVSTDPDFSSFVSGYQSKSIPANTTSEEVRISLTQGTMYRYRLRAVLGGEPGFDAAGAAAWGLDELPYTQNFDKDDGSWTAGGVESSWAWGKPAGQEIGADAGGNGKAWVTNLSGNYNDNEVSWVQSPGFDLSDIADGTFIRFAFDIDYRTDGIFDYASLQYTTDGSTWQRLESSIRSRNWYHRWLFGWFGSSGGGVYTSVLSETTALAGQPLVSFRVFFHSDAHNSLEGFAFDNVEISAHAPVPITGLSLSPAVLTIDMENTIIARLNFMIEPSNATADRTLIWQSRNKRVAIASYGQVIALAAGTTTITVTSAADPAIKATAQVIVTAAAGVVPVTGLSIDQSGADPILTLGGSEATQTLTATVEPSNATHNTVTWESSAPNIAKVELRTGVVTAVAEGTATITARAGGQTATVRVTVNPAPPGTVAVTGVSIHEGDLTLTLASGAIVTAKLTAAVAPGNATDKTVTWDSSDPDVAKVDANGEVTAVGGGTATITARAGSESASVRVTVNLEPLSLEHAKAKALRVSPVPASDWLRLRLPLSAADEVLIRLSDLSGKPVRQWLRSSRGGAVEELLDIRPLPSGMYLLELISKNGRWTRKVLKQ